MFDVEAVEDLGRSSTPRVSEVVGFCGIDGCTPSMASQCAVKEISRGTFGKGALISFSRSASSSST